MKKESQTTARQAVADFIGWKTLPLLDIFQGAKDAGARISSARHIKNEEWRINIRLGRRVTRLPYMDEDQAAACIGLLGAPKRRHKYTHPPLPTYVS